MVEIIKYAVIVVASVPLLLLYPFVQKYFVKGVNGFNHSLAFTTGNYEDNLEITDFNRRVTEQSCRHCHGDVVHAIEARDEHFEELSCIRCHGDVGHR